jgi:2-hydroxy-3-keto-5-methylthiopentenyl-1-phosphate phosphatase
VAEQADVVFARDSLARHCDRSGIPFTPFEDFFQVLEALKTAGG